MRPRPWAPPVTSAVLPCMSKRFFIAGRRMSPLSRRSDRDHDFAELMGALEIAQRLLGIMQREHTVDDGAELVPLDEGERFLKLLQCSDIRPEYRDVLQKHIRCHYGNLRSPGGTIDHYPRAHTQRASVVGIGGGGSAIEHYVEPARSLANGLAPIRV